MTEFDHGPSAQLAELFDRVPDPPIKDDFWFDWGPVFYRGRLGGSARVLCLASDPGPTERIAGRCLVGNAGQRVQVLLAKLGRERRLARGSDAVDRHPQGVRRRRPEHLLAKLIEDLSPLSGSHPRMMPSG